MKIRVYVQFTRILYSYYFIVCKILYFLYSYCKLSSFSVGENESTCNH